MANRYKVIEAGEETCHIVDWIKDYFAHNGPGHKAIIGLSGGKDSNVAAALLANALGPDRVLGVYMPTTILADDPDWDDIVELTTSLKINVMRVPIGEICHAMYQRFEDDINAAVLTNTPARVRMTLLYQIAAMYNGRVCNTCNYSEDYIGYSTKYGDMAGDFAPLRRYTVREIIAMGKTMIPARLVEKTPADGMCGKSDEDNLGFTYKELDAYLLDKIKPSIETLEKIVERHDRNKHKTDCIHIPACSPKTRHWNDEEGWREKIGWEF